MSTTAQQRVETHRSNTLKEPVFRTDEPRPGIFALQRSALKLELERNYNSGSSEPYKSMPIFITIAQSRRLASYHSPGVGLMMKHSGETRGDSFRAAISPRRAAANRSARIDVIRGFSITFSICEHLHDAKSPTTTHYASRKNPNYVTTANYYHSTRTAATRLQAQLPAVPRGVSTERP